MFVFYLFCEMLKYQYISILRQVKSVIHVLTMFESHDNIIDLNSLLDDSFI